MKTQIFTLTLCLLVTGTTLACPILTGSYQCSNSQGQKTEISLQDLGGFKYKLEDSVVQAGPTPVTEVSEGMGFRIETKAVCYSDTLFVLTFMKNAETLSTISELHRRYVVLNPNQLQINFEYIDDQQRETTLVTCLRK